MALHHCLPSTKKKKKNRLKRAFLGESQQPIRRLSNRISSFRLETHSTFFTYVQLTFMLHYRISDFLLLELTIRKEFQSDVFQFIIGRAAMKTQSISLVFERLLYPFCPLLTTSLIEILLFIKQCPLKFISGNI